MHPLLPLNYTGGYLPLEDYGLIGDGTTAALVGRDGAIAWLCLPRFDSPPVFCQLLDHTRGGAFVIAPEGLQESRQSYDGESGILVTEMRSATGVIRVTDALTFPSGTDLLQDAPAGCGELLRLVQVVDGSVRVRIDIAPRGPVDAQRSDDGLRLHCPERAEFTLCVSSTMPLDGLQTVRELRAGAQCAVALRWDPKRFPHPPSEEAMRATRDTWDRWGQHLAYDGPQPALVRRSAITLKLLDYAQNGAIVAAPTSSLPEAIGGVRNWDYRYAWIRDAAFSVYALRRVGLVREAESFLRWALHAAEHHERPCVLYNLDGQQPPPEREDSALAGYRDSRPVRWGNAAADQRQHDVYGEILDCAYQWSTRGGAIDPALWTRLHGLIEGARAEWRQPDHGIWEVRTAGHVFTYSAALCQVALDRGVRLAERFHLPGDVTGWRTAAKAIRNAIITESWSDELRAFTEHLGGGRLDASLLSLPLRRVVPAEHPRMVATTAAITAHLGAGKGLLYRYLPDESPDGVPGHEGAFLLCSFWLVDNLARQGRVDEALELYNSLCGRASPLGLLPEQIDPSTGAFLGNYPQAFSHVGVISSGVTLTRVLVSR